MVSPALWCQPRAEELVQLENKKTTMSLLLTTTLVDLSFYEKSRVSMCMQAWEYKFSRAICAV